MNTPLLLTLFFTLTICQAQDYVAVVKNNDVTYYYPENTTFRLYNNQNEVTEITKENPVEVAGNYRLEADVFWKDTPEVIISNGGSLAIYFEVNKYFKELENYKNEERGEVYNFNNNYSPPKELTRNYYASKKNLNTYNVSLTFSNGMEVNFIDGDVIAYEKGKALSVEGRYLIYGAEAVLKLSYNPKNKVVWYYFEKSEK